MYYKKRKMVQEHTHDGSSSESDDLSHQLCFVHRVADLPLVSASLEQILIYYDKTKKYNRLVGASLHLAENGVKFFVQRAEPFRRMLDGPIVATNRIACNQLEKLEAKYPVIHITPNELFENGKVYYNNSYVKTAVDKTESLVSYGEGKVRATKELANKIVGKAVYVRGLRVTDYIRLGTSALNEAILFSDSLVNAYITAPDASQNSLVITKDPNSPTVKRVFYLSTKVLYGLKYRAGVGLEMTKEQVFNLINQTQIVLYLVQFAKSTTSWVLDESFNKISEVKAQASVYLLEMKAKAIKYGRKPDDGLLAMAQSMTSTLATLFDRINDRSSFLPENLHLIVVAAVQYVHKVNEMFNKAATLGDLRDDMLKEAREKLAVLQSLLFTVLDRLVVYPPISWLAAASKRTNDLVAKNLPNGVVIFDGVKETDKNK